MQKANERRPRKLRRFTRLREAQKMTRLTRSFLSAYKSSAQLLSRRLQRCSFCKSLPLTDRFLGGASV